MTKRWFTALMIAGLTSTVAQAEFEKYPEAQAKHYIAQLDKAGQEQAQYKDFKKTLVSLQKQGHAIDDSKISFYAETTKQVKENGQSLHNWLKFEIEIGFSSTRVRKNGTLYNHTPTLRIEGRAQELCDLNDRNCEPPTSVEFNGPELDWKDVPVGAGGGTSSAGNR